MTLYRTGAVLSFNFEHGKMEVRGMLADKRYVLQQITIISGQKNYQPYRRRWTFAQIQRKLKRTVRGGGRRSPGQQRSKEEEERKASALQAARDTVSAACSSALVSVLKLERDRQREREKKREKNEEREREEEEKKEEMKAAAEEAARNAARLSCVSVSALTIVTVEAPVSQTDSEGVQERQKKRQRGRLWQAAVRRFFCRLTGQFCLRGSAVLEDDQAQSRNSI